MCQKVPLLNACLYNPFTLWFRLIFLSNFSTTGLQSSEVIRTADYRIEDMTANHTQAGYPSEENFGLREELQKKVNYLR